MLGSLKEMGRNVGHEVGRAWESLSEGWHELLSRGSGALTHFSHRKDEGQPESAALSSLPRWSLLAGEVEETDKDVVVRVEMPGVAKEDCRITIEGNMLYLSGEKHFEREAQDSAYHVMERAYGLFQRGIPLPLNVDIDRAEATCANGVLTVRLPKGSPTKAKSIQVS